MKKALLSILLFPVDLLYFTIDGGIITWRSIRRISKKEQTQKCHFSEGEAVSETPHIVRSVLKYQNKWLVRLLAPHIHFQKQGPHIIALSQSREGYIRPPVSASLYFFGICAVWGVLIFGSLMAVSSDRGNFMGNFLSTFNPDSLGKE